MYLQRIAKSRMAPRPKHAITARCKYWDTGNKDKLSRTDEVSQHHVPRGILVEDGLAQKNLLDSRKDNGDALGNKASVEAAHSLASNLEDGPRKLGSPEEDEHRLRVVGVVLHVEHDQIKPCRCAGNVEFRVPDIFFDVHPLGRFDVFPSHNRVYLLDD
jgi:hypothetical protein